MNKKMIARELIRIAKWMVEKDNEISDDQMAETVINMTDAKLKKDFGEKTFKTIEKLFIPRKERIEDMKKLPGRELEKLYNEFKKEGF